MKPPNIIYRVERKSSGVSLEACDDDARCLWRIIDEPLWKFNFDFGYSGPRSWALALAVLKDFTESFEVATHLNRAFALDHVVSWTGASAEIDGATIAKWIDGLQSAAAKAFLRANTNRRVPEINGESR